MKKRIQVGIIGATGMVGQNYICLLKDHPWFEISFLAASERSAGKSYKEAVKGKWRMDSALPAKIAEMQVFDAAEVTAAVGKCSFVFSAFSMSKEKTAALEKAYAGSGFPVVSNNSAQRMTANVPIIIPEINHEIIQIIPDQRKAENWDSGFIVTKPNCGVQSYLLPIAAIRKAGYEITEIITTNLQALSGAGYPGVSAMDVIDNITALPSEEEKAFCEPQKIFGSIENGEIISDNNLKINSNCIRVPVVHGHTSCVWFSIKNSGKEVEVEELEEILMDFRSEPQRLNLPSAPNPVIRYFRDDEHPQPREDRDAAGGMAVTVGRLKKSSVMGYRFTALSHNTVRGAAGGSILTAELLTAKGFIK